MISQFDFQDDDAPTSSPTILVEVDPQSNGPTTLPGPPLVPFLFTAEQRLPRPSPVPADFAERGQIDHTVFYNAPPPSMRAGADQLRPTVMEHTLRSPGEQHMQQQSRRAALALVPQGRGSRRPTVRVTTTNGSTVRRAFRPSSPPTMPPPAQRVAA